MENTTSRHRWRITVAALMGAIALIAVLLNSIRPIGESEAVAIARRYLCNDSYPGASEWAKLPTRANLSDDGDGGGLWHVSFVNPTSNELFVSVIVDLRGNPECIFLVEELIHSSTTATTR